MQGVVHQVNTSGGGVPKLPVPTGRLEVGGVVGDMQADRKHHGGPDQDLCLFSLEVLAALRDEGHPILPGGAGENLTLSGLDWAAMRPGLRLRIGAEAIAELTWPAAPCAKNSRWFSDRDHTRISHELHPGWSRWYARVLVPGDVTAGDLVVEDGGSS